MRKQTLHPRTAAINQKQKNQSKKSRLDALHWLAKKFPEAFDNTQHIRPLNLGIMNQILTYADEAAKDNISKSKLREAVVLYTRRLDYLACLKAKEPRIDLFGNPGEKVSAEDAESAANKIRQRVEKSIKNARRLATAATEIPKQPKAPTQETPSQPVSYSSRVPERPQSYNMDSNFAPAARSQSVLITHKQTRQYDPDAVARLKAKLGLSRKKEESK
ncbi:MAG: ProQ/FinO family protein [Legionellaceae bacterium]|nr:ProQ/FinO family protein [Legionellaceae bacterium]